MNRKLAVLGSPIEQSKSPTIHAAAYRVLGLDWQYSRHAVIKGGLKSYVDELEADWLGLSLTMPLKEQAARIAESLDHAAQLTGAANTLVRTATGWSGFNTDVFGIVEAIKRANLQSLEHVLILGSGATAKSALVALSELNDVKGLSSVSKVLIYARNSEAKADLVSFAKKLGLNAKATKNLKKAAKKSSLTISTLPAHVLDEFATNTKRFSPRGALFDVAYEPWPSAIATVYRNNGQLVLSGLEMLLWQAIAQIRLFNGLNATESLPNEAAVVEAMRHSLESYRS